MEQIRGIMSQFNSEQRRKIALVMAFLVSYTGCFVRSLKIKDEVRAFSHWMSKHDIVDTMLTDGGVSIGDMFFLSMEHGEILIWLGATAVFIGFCGAFYLTYKAIDSMDTDIPMVMLGVSVVAAVYSFLLLFSSYGNFVTFSLVHFFRIGLSILLVFYWRLACETPGAVGEPGGKCHTCPNCHKVLNEKAQFCNGCGQSVSFGASGCKTCHAPLATGAQFCPKCGARTE